MRPDEVDGFYIVRLDRPARHYALGVGTGEFELLDEIVEGSVNLERID